MGNPSEIGKSHRTKGKSWENHREMEVYPIGDIEYPKIPELNGALHRISYAHAVIIVGG